MLAICGQDCDLRQPHDTAEVGLGTRVAGEDLLEALGAEVFHGDFAEDGSEVRSQGEVSVFVELLRSKSRPLAEDLAAVHIAAEGEEAGRVAVVGAVRAVRPDRSTELTHG